MALVSALIFGSGVLTRVVTRDAYQAVDLIDWPEGFCRRDIGWRGL